MVGTPPREGGILEEPARNESGLEDRLSLQTPHGQVIGRPHRFGEGGDEEEKKGGGRDREERDDEGAPPARPCFPHTSRPKCSGSAHSEARGDDRDVGGGERQPGAAGNDRHDHQEERRLDEDSGRAAPCERLGPRESRREEAPDRISDGAGQDRARGDAQQSRGKGHRRRKSAPFGSSTTSGSKLLRY